MLLHRQHEDLLAPILVEHRTEEEPLVLLKIKYFQRKCILPIKTERGKKSLMVNCFGELLCAIGCLFTFFGRGWGGWACFDLGFGGFLLHYSLLLSFAEPFDGDFAP